MYLSDSVQIQRLKTNLIVICQADTVYVNIYRCQAICDDATLNLSVSSSETMYFSYKDQHATHFMQGYQRACARSFGYFFKFSVKDLRKIDFTFFHRPPSWIYGYVQTPRREKICICNGLRKRSGLLQSITHKSSSLHCSKVDRIDFQEMYGYGRFFHLRTRNHRLE